MPRCVTARETEALLAFARRAGQVFLADPGIVTWTAGAIEPGALFAVRWGLEPAKAHAVLVLRLDANFDPIIIGDLDDDRAGRARR